jgi:hypothetical protein
MRYPELIEFVLGQELLLDRSLGGLLDGGLGRRLADPAHFHLKDI